MCRGWIKLHKSILDWEWFKDHKTVHVFNYCLLKANFKEGRFQGKIIPVGSFVTGRKQIAQDTGLTEQEVRTAIFKLKSTSNLTIKSTSKYSIISITNWQNYQAEQPANAISINQQSTTIEEYKNKKEDKKEDAGEYDFDIKTMEAWQQAYPGVDIQSEIKKAMAWEISNPRNSKKNKKRFVNSWLSRAKPSPIKKSQTDMDARMKLQRELMGA